MCVKCPQKPKGVPKLLEQELEEIVRHHVGAGNQTLQNSYQRS